MKKERYEAFVRATNDDQKRGRIKVSCPDLTGDNTTIPVWLEYSPDWGHFNVPEIGQQVTIEANADSLTDPVKASFVGPQFRWYGASYYNKDGPFNVNPVFQTNYGKRRGFSTPVGHYTMYDDTPGQEQITTAWSNAAGENSFDSFDKDGSKTIATKSGLLIYLNEKDGSVLINDKKGNRIQMDSSGISMVNGSGKTYISVNEESIEIQSNKVKIAGQEALLLAQAFLAQFDEHTHATGTGPSGPPILPLSNLRGLTTF